MSSWDLNTVYDGSVVGMREADYDILGVVGAELRDKQWSKILSLAPMHV